MNYINFRWKWISLGLSWPKQILFGNTGNPESASLDDETDHLDSNWLLSGSSAGRCAPRTPLIFKQGYRILLVNVLVTPCGHHLFWWGCLPWTSFSIHPPNTILSLCFTAFCLTPSSVEHFFSYRSLYRDDNTNVIRHIQRVWKYRTTSTLPSFVNIPLDLFAMLHWSFLWFHDIVLYYPQNSIKMIMVRSFWPKLGVFPKLPPPHTNHRTRNQKSRSRRKRGPHSLNKQLWWNRQI